MTSITDSSINRIVIAGGGTAGWMAAAYLARNFSQNGVSITLIESSEISTIGVGEATIPTIREFYQGLGLQDKDVIQQTQGSIKLGIQFSDWHTLGESYFHPFGIFGKSTKQTEFYQYWLKSFKLGQVGNIEDFSLPIMLAQKNKFMVPSNEPAKSLQHFDWALHLDAGLFADMLKTFSKSLGVHHIDNEITHVARNTNSGFIERLQLKSGQSVEGDFFIDCTGFKALLIEGALETGFVDWSKWLPVNSAQILPTESPVELPSYTHVKALTAGWQWRIPLQNRTGNGHVYCNDFICDDKANQQLRDNAEGKPIGDSDLIRFTTGRRKKAWNKNCLALGLSAGFVEPLESTSISVIVTALENFKTLFPDKTCNPLLADEFNARSEQEIEQIRDFIILHYKATNRDDSELWRYCKNMGIPDNLTYRLELFKEQGILLNTPWQTFHPPSWTAILHGNKIHASRYHPVVDSIDSNFLEQEFKKLRMNIEHVANQGSSHRDFLNRMCPAIIK